jgi:hypothetical protein
MIAGVEGIHAWTPPGAGAVALELNRIFADDGSPVWPRFKVKRVIGLMGNGEPEDNRDRPPGRPIEIPRRSERRGKTVVYEGVIQARTLLQLREAESTLRAAFDDLEGEGRMNVSWHPLLEAFADVPPKYFEARSTSGVEIADVQEAEGWERSFVIGLRMGDRRYFDETSGVHTAETTDALTAYALA